MVWVKFFFSSLLLFCSILFCISAMSLRKLLIFHHLFHVAGCYCCYCGSGCFLSLYVRTYNTHGLTKIHTKIEITETKRERARESKCIQWRTNANRGQYNSIKMLSIILRCAVLCNFLIIARIEQINETQTERTNELNERLEHKNA